MCRRSITARSMRKTNTSPSSAAATRRWIACAPPCARARNPSPASIAATATTCRARLREVANAEEEGVVFEWLTLPKAFLGQKNVEGVRLTRMRLGMPDASGRKAPEEVEGRGFHARCRSRHQGAGLRCRRSAGDIRSAGPCRHALGHGAGEAVDTDEQPRRRVRGAATSCAAPRWSCGRSATAAMRRRRSTNISKAKAQPALAAE